MNLSVPNSPVWSGKPIQRQILTLALVELVTNSKLARSLAYGALGDEIDELRQTGQVPQALLDRAQRWLAAASAGHRPCTPVAYAWLLLLAALI